MKKNKFIYEYLFIASFFIGIVLLLFGLKKYQEDGGINSFDQCVKAGYSVMESYPRRCRRQDGKEFVEEPDKVECKGDSECGDDYFCLKGLCVEFSLNTRCVKDTDCILINRDNRFSCCFTGQCEAVDYSLDKWVGVNREWYIEQKRNNCPPADQCGPAPMCMPRPINDKYKARCVSRLCEKVPVDSGHDYYGRSTYGACLENSDCIVSGCNGEICQSKDEEPINSICVVPKDPTPKQLGLECLCFKNECQWIN